MSQAIIFTNDNGGVSVCIPTGELSIEETQAKDTPAGSIIIDTADLPTENEFFNAWELVNGKVVVNADKKSAILKDQCATKAKELLAKTDWTQVPDVGLKNSADFVTYRGILRGLVIQPQETPDFPVEPKAVWS
jgi:hypothetical protein